MLLDISQVTKGHTLLVPKSISYIFETDEETMNISVQLCQSSNAIKSAFNPDGLNIIQNNVNLQTNLSIYISIYYQDMKMILMVSVINGKRMKI